MSSRLDERHDELPARLDVARMDADRIAQGGDGGPDLAPEQEDVREVAVAVRGLGPEPDRLAQEGGGVVEAAFREREPGPLARDARRRRRGRGGRPRRGAGRPRASVPRAPPGSPRATPGRATTLRRFAASSRSSRRRPCQVRYWTTAE